MCFKNENKIHQHMKLKCSRPKRYSREIQLESGFHSCCNLLAYCYTKKKKKKKPNKQTMFVSFSVVLGHEPFPFRQPTF